MTPSHPAQPFDAASFNTAQDEMPSEPTVRCTDHTWPEASSAWIGYATKLRARCERLVEENKKNFEDAEIHCEAANRWSERAVAAESRLAALREEVIEECAKVCDKQPVTDAPQCAQAIRALAQRGKG